MDIAFKWDIKDMQWDQTSGMILEVRADYVGVSTCIVGSSTETMTTSVEKVMVLNPSESPIGIDTVTRADVSGWLDAHFETELPTIKKEISDYINPRTDEYLRSKHVTQYIGVGTIMTIGGGLGQNPNNSW